MSFNNKIANFVKFLRILGCRSLAGVFLWMWFSIIVAPAACTLEPSDALAGLQTQRYQKLIEGLRCLVCQNQSVAESEAALAKDIRDKVRELIWHGKTNEQIHAYMVDRFGEFVLYKPPFRLETYFLWIGPFVLLLIGCGILFYMVLVRNNNAKNKKNNVPRSGVDATST